MSEMPVWPEWLKEMFVEFGVACLIIFIRICTRCSIVGWVPWKGWKGDDYLILLALVCYGLCVAAMWIMLHNPPGMGIPHEKIALMTAKDKAKWKVYADTNMWAWFAYLTYFWSLKACLLFFYKRLTMGLWQMRLVKIAAWVVGVTYIMAILFIFFHCGWPVSKNWVVGPEGQDICNGNWTQYVGPFPLNLLTDILIFCIPAPLLWRSNIPLRRKIAISFVLCSGVLLMVATVLRNTLALASVLGRPIDVNLIFGWLSRELFVAAFVVNLPCIRPIFSRRYWRATRIYKLYGSKQPSAEVEKPASIDGSGSDESGKLSEAEMGKVKPLTYGIIQLPKQSAAPPERPKRSDEYDLPFDVDTTMTSPVSRSYTLSTIFSDHAAEVESGLGSPTGETSSRNLVGHAL